MRDCIVRNSKAAVLEDVRGGDGVDGVLELEPAGKAWGFFKSDFREGVAEKVFVVEIDARNDGDDGRKNVSGIEAAAEADFKHAECNALAGERLESHGRYTFEISGMRTKFAGGEEFFDQDLNAREGVGESFITDLLAMDANAFVDFFEMGRGVEARSKATLTEDGFEKRSG